MQRIGLWLTIAFLVTAPACTKTVYLVRNPDGSFSEVEVQPPDRGVPVGDGDLVIEVLTSNDYILDGADLPLYLQFDLIAPKVEIKDRAPVNLAIVVDRSGSMSGAKLRNAKTAAIALAGRLQDGDRVSVVSYADDVTVDLPSTPVGPGMRPLVAAVIQRLQPAGRTFLSGGLIAGADAVRVAVGPGTLTRVILLSDGNANIGLTEPHRLDRLAGSLRAAGISVSTMGLGLDYNEDVMTALAVAGGGNYYFIEDPRALVRIFGAELDTLASTVTRDTMLILDLPPGVNLKEVYGYRWERRGQQLRVHVNALASGARRRVLMAMDVPDRGHGALDVARGRIEYRSELTKRQRTVDLRPVRVTYTNDRRRVAASMNRKVVEKLELVRNARVRGQIMAHLDKGDRAGAVRVLESRLTTSRAIHRRMGGAGLARQVDDLVRLRDEVRTAPPPASTRYRGMKKARKAEATKMLMH